MVIYPFLLAAFSVCLLHADLNAQTGTIRGRVFEAETGEGLWGAIVVFQGSRYGDVAKEDGRFFVNAVLPGVYTVVASCVGWDKAEKTITVRGGDTITIDLALEPWGTREAHEDISAGRAKIRWYGLLVRAVPLWMRAQEDSVTKKYGFTYEEMGCRIRVGDGYNDVVSQYLDKRNGEGWRERLDREYHLLMEKADDWERARTDSIKERERRR
jgi:hypothetical protein